MIFADLGLARRLERAEGRACVQFAEARRRLLRDCDAKWMECAGAYAVFNGVDSPITQTFGLGIFEEATAAALGEIERFFLDRGAAVMHEVSPLAGAATLGLLCARGYRPMEVSNVMYRPVEKPAEEGGGGFSVRVTGPDEAERWAGVSAKGWAHEHPELLETLLEFGAAIPASTQSVCFLAEWNGEPGAAGALNIDEGVALFSGASTIPEMRRRGLQGALLRERMRYAFEHGCDLAMMVADAGGDSQRNAERKGFRVAYTRMKWRLSG